LKWYQKVVSFQNVTTQWATRQDFLVSFQNMMTQWATIQDFLVSFQSVTTQWATRQDFLVSFQNMMTQWAPESFVWWLIVITFWNDTRKSCLVGHCAFMFLNHDVSIK
jgi:hypothetical protein